MECATFTIYEQLANFWPYFQNVIVDGVRDIYEQVTNFFTTGSTSNISTAFDAPRRSFAVTNSYRKRSRQHSLDVMNENYRDRTLSDSSNHSKKSENKKVNFSFDNPTSVSEDVEVNYP